jgi:hypothetical protein
LDKHTPLTKLTKNDNKHNPTEKKKKTKFKENIQDTNQDTKKSKAPLLPAQKNKYHYIIEQNYYKTNFPTSTWLNNQRKMNKHLDDLPLRKLNAN